MTHYEQCLVNAKAHHATLVANVKNPNAIEGLMKTFLDQPAYEGHRDQLLRAVMGQQ